MKGEGREGTGRWEEGKEKGGRKWKREERGMEPDIILLATTEAELQELVDRLDRVSRKHNLLINVDKIKVMASDGIACRILIQN